MFNSLAFIPFMGTPSGGEMLVLGIIALLLFGKRLPEVARSLGKGIVEFKKGVSGIEDDIDKTTYSSEPVARQTSADDRAEVTAPAFEPPSAPPE